MQPQVAEPRPLRGCESSGSRADLQQLEPRKSTPSTSALRFVGNAQVGRLVQQFGRSARPVLRKVCACEGGCPSCDSVQAERDVHAALQRQHRPPGGSSDPDDLTGTKYDAFRPEFKAALKTKFDRGGKPTLREALDDMSFQMLAVLARMGARISAYDAGLWQYITAIPRSGGWTTDNWGAMFDLDVGGMSAYLMASPKWCKDDPSSAMHYHGTQNCYREIAGSSPGLHVPVKARADIHVDYHQPADGKGSDGQCTWAAGEWSAHALDVGINSMGGRAGASATGVAVYATLRDRARRFGGARPTGVSEQDVRDATRLLDEIAPAVGRYAAMGELSANGRDFEGDLQMQQDAVTMAKLTRAERHLSPFGVLGRDLVT